MSDPKTVFVLGPSGVVLETDVPTNPHALKRYQERLKSGDYTVVNKADVVEQDTRHGGKILVVKPKPEAKATPKAATSKD